MQKRLIIGALAVLGLGLLLRVFSTPGQAARTEHRLADAVTKSTGTAAALERDFATPGKLPAELTEFAKTTDRLRQLSGDLGNDITAYETATTRYTFGIRTLLPL